MVGSMHWTLQERATKLFSDGIAPFSLDVLCNVKGCGAIQIYSLNKIQVTVHKYIAELSTREAENIGMWRFQVS